MHSNFGEVSSVFLTQPLSSLDPAPALCLPAHTPVGEALRTMQRHQIGCVVVTDDHQKLVGIFSERDNLMRITLQPLEVHEVPLSEVMTHAPHAERLTTSIAFALHLMAEGGFRHLPLVDDRERPVGLLSVKDLLRCIQQELLRQMIKKEFGIEGKL